MKVHVAARNSEYAEQFVSNNPGVDKPIIHEGVRSLFDLLQSIIAGDDEYALFVHDDVFLPKTINANIENLINQLNSEWPNWGICGNAGVIVPEIIDGSRICRFLFDQHEGNNLSGCIMPAETVDGNSILLNCRALKNANVKLPKFNGFQFYDISLSIETLCAGLAVLIAPDLSCYHNSGRNLKLFNDASQSKKNLDYLKNKICNRSIVTLNGTINIPFLYEYKETQRIDLSRKALENALVGRPEAGIAFVIRTQFRDISLLRRAILSTLAFAASLKTGRAKTYVFTDRDIAEGISDLENEITLVVSRFETKSDTRNLLIEKSIEIVVENHILFLDDDDFVFPNESNFVLQLLACLPSTTSLVVDSLNFEEQPSDADENNFCNSYLKNISRFHSAKWPLNLNGNNHIPICGVFYSRKILLQQPKETFEKIDLFEDYTATMYALLNQESFFFSVPVIVAGICVRATNSSAPNVVNVKNRTKWSQSQSEVAFLLSNRPYNNVLLAMSQQRTALDNTPQAIHLKKYEKIILLIARMTFVGFKILIKPSKYIKNSQFIVSSLKKVGFKTALRALIYRDIKLN